MNLWKWKRTSRLEGEQPAAAIRSATAEAETPALAGVPAVPVDVALPERPVDVPDPERLPAFTLPPASVSLERSFCQDGFVVVPQVFDQAEMAELRRAAIAHFPNNRPPFEPTFSNTALHQEPFRRVFRNRKFIQALRSVLGEDFVFINEMSLHDSFYVGWHTDTASPEFKADHEFHWSPGFCIVQIAIYLQDNGENGGGLDVVPGSYIRDDPFAARMRREKGLPSVSRMPEPEDPYRGGVSIRSRAGDVVIFHYRLSHRASRRSSEAQNAFDRKLAMFMTAGPNNAQTRRYRAWLDQYDQMNGTTRPVLPDDFRSLLSEMGHSVL
jgi:hypothetical protein